MLEYNMLHFRPSHVAAAATLLAELYCDVQNTRWEGQRPPALLRCTLCLKVCQMLFYSFLFRP